MRRGPLPGYRQPHQVGLRGPGHEHPGEARMRRRRIGADVSHAWVGAWLGPDHGWVDLDPTNDLLVGDEHVVLAWGRDYADVSPTRGVILGGGGTHGLKVSVDLEPLEEPG